MKKCSIIIGMGIGQLYNTVLEKLNHNIVTVDQDPSQGADFLTVEDAIKSQSAFDTAHICTPNFTHYDIACKIAPYAKIVFVEKPGVIDSMAWTKLVTNFLKTRFMMVKNNMWRSNIAELKKLASCAETVNISWIRRNCIPSPGSWFTTKELAFGGVSRDLMPHLLSLYVAMNPDWYKDIVSSQDTMMNWALKDIESTDYGTINPNGVYNVDDKCYINFSDKWCLTADWRSMNKEDSSIEFIMHDNSIARFELGWCPEDAYESMIKEAVEQLDNSSFWTNQFNIDQWIHERIETL